MIRDFVVDGQPNELTVNPPPLTDDAFGVGIRFGPPPEARVIARLIAANRACCAPHPAIWPGGGTPQTAADLAQHSCIGIRQGEQAYGLLRLTGGRGKAKTTRSVRTKGSLSTNDGEIDVNWALDGHGVLLRAEGDIERFLGNGRLVRVLPQFAAPDADICAVYPRSHQTTARVRSFVDYVAASLGQQASARAERS